MLGGTLAVALLSLWFRPWSEWRRLSPEGKRYSILMPGKPVAQRIPVGGGTVTVTLAEQDDGSFAQEAAFDGPTAEMYEVERHGATWSVASLHCGYRRPETILEAELEGMRSGIASVIFTLREHRAVDLDGVPGVEVYLDAGELDLGVWKRIYVDHGTKYVLSVVGSPEGEEGERLVQRYFDSFSLRREEPKP
jgi:hypothetical protein